MPGCKYYLRVTPPALHLASDKIRVGISTIYTRKTTWFPPLGKMRPLPATASQGKPFLTPGELPNPGIKPRHPTLKADCSPAEPPDKPKNARVGRLSLLQQSFPTHVDLGGVLGTPLGLVHE